MLTRPALSFVFACLVVSSAAWAWSPGFVHRQSPTPSVSQTEKGSTRIAARRDVLTTIRAVEDRSQKQHEQLLEDTQALADAYNGLSQENADRVAEIAALKSEVAAIRAELSALKAARP